MYNNKNVTYINNVLKIKSVTFTMFFIIIPATPAIPPHNPGPRYSVRLAAELGRVLVLPGRDVPAGLLHVDVGRDHDAQPGALVDHGVGVDLAHVVPTVLGSHLSAAKILHLLLIMLC